MPPRFGKPDTVNRHFSRLSDAGLWERLLRALACPDRPAALGAVEHRVCCACRRVGCRRDMRTITAARRSAFPSALRPAPHMLPDLDLSERVHHWIEATLEDAFAQRHAVIPIPRDFLREARRWLTPCGGRLRIPRAVLPC